jgi:membrane protein involved in colicin uptake
MSQKVYWDDVNKKEVVDVTGAKVEADVIAEYSLDASTQVVEIDEGDSTYVDNGTLTKKTKAEHDQEKADDKAAKDADKATKKASSKTALGLNDTQWDDLVTALGLD